MGINETKTNLISLKKELLTVSLFRFVFFK